MNHKQQKKHSGTHSSTSLEEVLFPRVGVANALELRNNVVVDLVHDPDGFNRFSVYLILEGGV